MFAYGICVKEADGLTQGGWSGVSCCEPQAEVLWSLDREHARSRAVRSKEFHGACYMVNTAGY